MNDRPNLPRLAGELAELARHAPGKLSERLQELSVTEQADLAPPLPAVP